MASCFYDRDRHGQDRKCQNNDETEFKLESFWKGHHSPLRIKPSHFEQRRLFSTYDLRPSFSPFCDATMLRLVSDTTTFPFSAPAENSASLPNQCGFHAFPCAKTRKILSQNK